jgi:hypothetical protein
MVHNFVHISHRLQIRQLGKTGKYSIIENVAPDPGSCTRVMLRLHSKARIFSLYSAVSARTPKTEGTATPRGKLFPRRDLPSAIDGRPHQLVRPLASGQERTH